MTLDLTNKAFELFENSFKAASVRCPPYLSAKIAFVAVFDLLLGKNICDKGSSYWITPTHKIRLSDHCNNGFTSEKPGISFVFSDNINTEVEECEYDVEYRFLITENTPIDELFDQVEWVIKNKM